MLRNKRKPLIRQKITTPASQAKIIAITGSIGSGKSTVSHYIESQGYPVISADQLAHALYEPGQPAYDAIVDHFGVQVLEHPQEINSLIDRKKLRAILFENEFEKKWMEHLIHPLVRSESQRRFQVFIQNGARVLFYEVPLLFEAKQEKTVDGILLITCERSQQIDRLLKRDLSLTPTQAESILAQQWPDERKRAMATWEITNNGSLEALYQKVDEFLQSEVGIKWRQ